MDESSEFLARTWRTRCSEMGTDRGSRLRVPDSERVLVIEANKRMFPSWTDGDLKEEEKTVLPWRIALPRRASKTRLSLPVPSNVEVQYLHFIWY